MCCFIAAFSVRVVIVQSHTFNFCGWNTRHSHGPLVVHRHSSFRDVWWFHPHCYLFKVLGSFHFHNVLLFHPDRFLFKVLGTIHFCSFRLLFYDFHIHISMDNRLYFTTDLYGYLVTFVCFQLACGEACPGTGCLEPLVQKGSGTGPQGARSSILGWCVTKL